MPLRRPEENLGALAEEGCLFRLHVPEGEQSPRLPGPGRVTGRASYAFFFARTRLKGTSENDQDWLAEKGNFRKLSDDEGRDRQKVVSSLFL